jgi:hypothetical protein
VVGGEGAEASECGVRWGGGGEGEEGGEGGCC